MNINRIFDKVFCLSLESRHDRWLAVNQEFIDHNIKVERFLGIQGNLLEMPLTANVKAGAVACNMGHLFLHKLAEMQKLHSFLIFEDDIALAENASRRFYEIYQNEIPQDWDIIYLGGQHFCGQNLTQVSTHVFKCQYTLTTHAVGFKHTVYKKCINALHNLTLPCDVSYAQMHKNLNAYVVIPHLAWQKPGFSDVENGYVDYTYLKGHTYEKWQTNA